MIGVIQWYNTEKGFGVIKGEDDKEYFLHFKNQIILTQRFYENDVLTFIPAIDQGRLSAKEAESFQDAHFYAKIIQEDISNNTNSAKAPSKYIGLINKYIAKQREETKGPFSDINKQFINEKLLLLFKEFDVLESKDQIENLIKKHKYNISFYALTEDHKTSFLSQISDFIQHHCTVNNLVNAYLLGYIDTIPDDDLISHFKVGDINTKTELLIKTASNTKLQTYLFNELLNTTEVDKIFTVLKACLSKIRGDYFSADKIYNTEYWQNASGKNLRDEFVLHCLKIEDPRTQCDLYLKEYRETPNIDFLISKPNSFDIYQLKKMYACKGINKSEIHKSLINRLMILLNAELDGINYYSQIKENNRLANEVLFSEDLETYNLTVANSFYGKTAIEAWLNDIVVIFPESDFISNILESENIYTRIVSKFIRENDVKTIQEILLKRIHHLKSVIINDRPTFYNIYWSLYSLFYQNESRDSRRNILYERKDEIINKIQNINNSYFNLILWSFDLVETINLDDLQDKYIYFSPKEQIYILRKLVWLKSIDKLSFNLEDLGNIKRISTDIYSINEKLNNDVGLDITVDFVITCLLNYSESRQFNFEKEVFDILFKNTTKKPFGDIQIKEIFENCKGRLLPTWRGTSLNDSTNTISRARLMPGGVGNDFIIRFNYDDSMKEKVKKLQGARWNSSGKFWSVPGSSEEQVVEFGKHHWFILNITGDKFKDNHHLATYIRKEVPDGITFCEGRPSKKIDNLSKKIFYWCHNNKCHGLCETAHREDQWQEYNFLDFCRIFNLDVNENKSDEILPNGEYYKLTGQINRFNRLLKRLHCTDCDHLLHPTETSHFAFYRVLRFHCQNSKCANRETIYLHHCFNGKCNSIIDSRVSKQCPNNWYICETCTSCCSHLINERRLSNLQETGGRIPPALAQQVNAKSGHWERHHHYCYIDSTLMESEGANQYKCPKCGLERDISPYLTQREKVQDET